MNSAADMASPQKRTRFDLNACAKRRESEAPPKIPKAADIKLGAARDFPPPQTLADRLGNPAQVIGYDIETVSRHGFHLSYSW